MKVRLLILALIALILMLTRPACGQERDPFIWTGHEQALDRISTGLVGASIALNTVAHVREDGWKRGLALEACESGLAAGTSELAKLLVKRWRPNRYDRKSFFSEHSALAGANRGFQVQVGWTMAGFTAGLRVGSGWHFASDVGVGLADGWLAPRLCGKWL